MSYAYAELRPTLFTEEGVDRLTQIRRNVGKASAGHAAVSLTLRRRRGSGQLSRLDRIPALSK